MLSVGPQQGLWISGVVEWASPSAKIVVINTKENEQVTLPISEGTELRMENGTAININKIVPGMSVRGLFDGTNEDWGDFICGVFTP